MLEQFDSNFSEPSDKNQKRPKTIIGRNELFSLLDGPLIDIPAKIDTGAYRSAVHATNIHVLRPEGELPRLVATLLGHPSYLASYENTWTEFETTEVRSSNGQTEVRYVVKLRMKVGGRVFAARVSLADRSDNLFPLLIGRRTIAKGFLVDVSQASVDRMQLQDLVNDNECDSEEE